MSSAQRGMLLSSWALLTMEEKIISGEEKTGLYFTEMGMDSGKMKMKYYGLKLGRGLENQASRPHKKIRGASPRCYLRLGCV